MTGLSATGESDVLAPLIANAYVSLHVADPGPTGASEVTGGAYLRQGPIAFSQLSGPEPTVQGNAALVTFPAATAPWGVVTHFGLWIDPSSTAASNFLGSGQLTAPSPVNNGDTSRFLPSSLTITAQ
jgi:hypothetical protein